MNQNYDKGVQWYELERPQRLQKIFELYARAQAEKKNVLEPQIANSSEPLEFRISEAAPVDTSRVVSFIPDSYRSNETREDVVLEFVENFNKQYTQLLQQRKPLMLYPENEVGVHKFVCTYIKPTLLPYPDLYDAQNIATFVHHHTSYEPLDKPFEIPEVVCSPTTTLYWQKGNSFDLSVLLASLLIGAGYSAYCVSGYAKKDIIHNDQTQRTFPFEIEPEEEPVKEEKKVFKESKYKLKTRPNLTSNFVKENYEIKEETEQIEKQVSEEIDSEKREGEELEDEDYSKKIVKSLKFVHCWVVVLPGRRDVKSPFFIEPSSGDVIEISDADAVGYQEIESVWNHENYWCHMFPEKKSSEVSFDLKDLFHWEHIFIHNNKREDLDEDDETHREEKINELLSIEEGEYDDDLLDVPTSWVGKISISKRKYEDRYPQNNKIVRYLNTTLELFSPYVMDDLLTKRITVYHDLSDKVKETHCYFSNRKDLLRRRSIYLIYASEESNNPVRQRIHEWFEPGRKTTSNFEGLREFVFEKGVRREYKFYSEGRLDGLERRVELFDGSKNMMQPRKVIEYFLDRFMQEDYLCYRSVCFDVEKPLIGIFNSDNSSEEKYGPIIGDMTNEKNNSSIDFSEKSTTDGGITRRKQLNETVVTKMTEKFLRNESKNANEDVAKRTFYITDKKIRLEYHFGEGKITRSVREYTKDGGFYTEIIDPFMPRPKLVETVEEFQTLLDTENKCREDNIKSTAEMASILQVRYSEENNIESTTTIYDVERNKPTEEEIRMMREKERELEEQRKNKDLVDHLIPKDGIKSVQQAEEIYYTVVKDLKDQLMMRINIIEERLQKEKQKLARRRTMYQKSQEGVDRNSEEYFQFCNDTLFKIRILKQRAEDHNARAAKKFAELKEKLLNHKQLGPFLKHLRNPKKSSNNL